MDDIVETNIDGLNPMEPVAGMDIGEVKQKYGDRICLIGNIDCGNLLSNGKKLLIAYSVNKEDIECGIVDISGLS